MNVKKKEITFETPEKIRFSYHIAEIGTRIAAHTIDQMIQIIVIVFIACVVYVNYITASSERLTHLTAAFLMIMVFVLRWFYYAFFEVVMEGQSPGKKLMRIRVIKDNGDPLDFETIIFRNFLRIVDDFPIIPLLGGFIALIDSQSRRIGDLVANTIVVNEIHYDLKLPDFQVDFQSHEKEVGFAQIKTRLNENELYIIRRFLNEYHKLPEKKQPAIAANLASQVRIKLGIEDDKEDAILFLERIYKQHGA